MQLSKKRETFCCHFIAFLECTLNFKHFEIKNEPHSLNTSEVIDCEKRGSLNA